MPDRCVEEGGILLVSGTPWPSPRVPIFHSVSRSVSQCPPVPASVPRCMCAGCGPRLLFALVARQIHPMPPQVCVQICSNWGVDYPGPGISVGDRPGRMAKCMWGPSSFNSRPGWSGLCVPSALGGASREQGTEGDGLQSSGTDRRVEGAPPRAVTVRAHRLQSTNGPARRTDGSSGSRIPRQ